MYYVYLHKRKGTNKVFYVGKGTSDRIESEKNRNEWWKHVVQKDGGFDYEIYKDNLTETEAFDLEKHLINEIGIDKLVNITEGGLGGDTLSNHPNLDKIGKKISEANKGDKNGNYGKGYYYWWVQKYGKEKADEMETQTRQKMSSKLKGKPNGSEKWLTGENNPSKKLEVRQKISIFAKERVREKVKCDICGAAVPNTHLSRHKTGKNCLH